MGSADEILTQIDERYCRLLQYIATTQKCCLVIYMLLLCIVRRGRFSSRGRALSLFLTLSLTLTHGREIKSCVPPKQQRNNNHQGQETVPPFQVRWREREELKGGIRGLSLELGTREQQITEIRLHVSTKGTEPPEGERGSAAPEVEYAFNIINLQKEREGERDTGSG